MSRTSPHDAEPKVKGVAFRSVITVATELLGEATMDRVFASLPDPEREMLRYKVINTGWYPISLYRALFRAILSTTGEGESLVRRIGAGAIRRDVTGVYRMVFKVLSPETVFSLSGKMFNQYYDTGTLAIESRAQRARAVYEGCKGFDRTMWEELAGAGEALIELAGGKNARMTITRGGDGLTDRCEMILAWD